jgi:hypothetical protein
MLTLTLSHVNQFQGLNAAFNEASSVGMMPTESGNFYVEACVSKFSSFRFYPT